jgi:hypothetical protein
MVAEAEVPADLIREPFDLERFPSMGFGDPGEQQRTRFLLFRTSFLLDRLVDVAAEELESRDRHQDKDCQEHARRHRHPMRRGAP